MKQILIIISVLINVNTFGQNPNDAIVVFSGGATRAVIMESKANETKGSVYYNDNWQKGTLKLFSGEEIRDYPLKYDLRLNQINIKSDNSIKIISSGAIKEINWINKTGDRETLINCSFYENSTEKVGFYKILYDGTVSFFKKTNLKILQSNYNGTVDVGDKSDKYIKENKYYVYTNNKVYPIRKSKRKILKFFNEKAEKVEEFATENNLSFKNENDLTKIFNYYNSL